MKVSERTLNIWALVSLRKEKYFINPNFVGNLEKMDRIMSIQESDHWKLRIWKEHFFKYTESIQGEPDYTPYAQKQLDEAIKEEVDSLDLLQSLLKRSEKQLEILTK